MQVVTKAEPLTINGFHSIFTGYPLAEKASFNCSDPSISDIWTVGWRTQRLCAGETFFDCPYYEQLQYAGDTRIQAFTTSYVSGDSLLIRNAISSLFNSRIPLGLTQSRFPTHTAQIIPPFSLVWTTMLYDYWMLHADTAYIRPMIPAVLEIFNWFESHLDTTGMIEKVEWWNFVDWVNGKDWKAGTPPGTITGHSSVTALQYVYTLQKGATLLDALGYKTQAAYYTRLAKKISTSVYQHCFDRQSGLLTDEPGKRIFSQHANLLAVLTNTIAPANQPTVMNKLLNDTSLAQCSYYFRFYLTEALAKAGLADKYLSTLGPWQEMLAKGLTTFAEQSDPTRSDCHAWSASPLYFFLSLVCGIQPETPGFTRVKVAPHFGKLNWMKGSMPHRLGMIQVDLKKATNGSINGVIVLPKGLTGTFLWKGKTIALKEEITQIHL
jgi:hypothetical protein